MFFENDGMVIIENLNIAPINTVNEALQIFQQVRSNSPKSHILTQIYFEMNDTIRTFNVLEVDCNEGSLQNFLSVLSKLSTKEQNIPFSKSKLTLLLKYTLQSKGIKYIMIANINQSEEDITLNMKTLKFATSVNNCEINN